MATAEQYAQWIVQNQAKKGTPEFETVARAYKVARGGQGRQQRTLDDYKAMSQPTAAPDVVGEMSGGQQFLAGVGMGMSRLGRGLGQAVGLVDQSEIDQAHGEEAALEETGAGRAGAITGTVAGLVPLAFAPGANTLGGAALLGAGSGALTTEGGLKERATGAGFGALGGAGGVAVGRGLASGSRALGQRAASAGAANAARNATIRETAEYVRPPSEMAQSAPGRFVLRSLENIAGKEAMGQSASIANQRIATAGMRADLGLPGKGQITQGELSSLKKPLFAVYEEAAKISDDAAEAVRLWRKANFEAKRQGVYYKRSANPAAQDAAEAARADAETYMGLIESEASAAGKPELAKKLADARIQLGKIGMAESALNKATGLTSGKQLLKAGARTGEMGKAAKFADAFEDYARPVKRTAMPGVSKLDAVATALLTSAGGARNLAFLGIPALTRNALLSRPVQALARPAANPGATRNALATALERERSLAAAGVAGNALSRR